MRKEPSGAHQAVGDLLRRYREIAGLSQEALAERAGLSARGLLYLERGGRRPYPATLRRLADALSLTPPQREALTLASQHGGAAVPPATQNTLEAPADRPPWGRPRSHRPVQYTTFPPPCPALSGASTRRPGCMTCSRRTAW